MSHAWRRGGFALPFVFFSLLFCGAPPKEGEWALPREGDPLSVVPEGELFWVAYRDGTVYHGPPWETNPLSLPPGLKLKPLPEGRGFIWLTRDQHRILQIHSSQVETLLSLPDTVAASILHVDVSSGALLVTLTSRILLYRKGAWWTLPFRGQTASLRETRGALVVFWAVGASLMQSRSPDGGRSWTSPETLLSFPFPIMEIHSLQEGVVVGWSTMLGPPLGFVVLRQGKVNEKPLLLWAGDRALVGTRVIQRDNVLLLVTTPVDTAFQPAGVQVRGLDLASNAIVLDTLFAPGLWLYDARVERNTLVVLAAGKGQLVRKVLKLSR